MILPEMDCYSPIYFHLYFFGGWQVCIYLHFFPDPMKDMSGSLAPFRGHGFVGIVCNEVGLHRQLASSDITQFEVMRSHKEP